MAHLGEGFDASNESEIPSQFSVMPWGIKTLILSEAEFRKTKNEKGEMLVAVFQVVEGDDEGKKIFENFMWSHSAAEGLVKNHKGRFNHLVREGLCQPHAKTTEELLDKPFKWPVGISPGDDQYGPKNFLMFPDMKKELVQFEKETGAAAFGAPGPKTASKAEAPKNKPAKGAAPAWGKGGKNAKAAEVADAPAEVSK